MEKNSSNPILVRPRLERGGGRHPGRVRVRRAPSCPFNFFVEEFNTLNGKFHEDYLKKNDKLGMENFSSKKRWQLKLSKNFDKQ